MFSTQEFLQRYQALSITELLRITQNPAQYQPQAVEAAAKTLKLRQPDEATLLASLQELEMEQAQKKQERERFDALVGKGNHAGDIAANTYQRAAPYQTGLRMNTTQLILICCIVWLFFSSADVWDSFRVAIQPGTDVFSVIAPVFPFVFLLVGSLLFFKRLKAGWMMLCIYVTHLSIAGLYALADGFYTLTRTDISFVFAYQSPIVYVVSLLFCGSMLAALAKPAVSQDFGTGKKDLYNGIGFGALVGIFYVVVNLL